MDLHRSPVAKALFALLLLNVIGVVGYVVLGHLTVLDALYMTVITLSTVGYREVPEVTTEIKIFTMVLLYTGLGLASYSIAIIARDVIEGGVQRALGRRRMQRQIAGVHDHFIVCGYGRMGRIVAKELAAKPVPFVVVDKHEEALAHAQKDGFLVIVGDATEDEVLLQAGIKRARGLVAALSNDSDNVYVVLSGRELNTNLLIVARAEDQRSERKLLHAGATRVVSPYVIGGHRMAHALLRPAVLDVIDLASSEHSLELQIEEVSVAADSPAAGVSLADAGVTGSRDVMLIGIKKRNGEMLFNPEPSTCIEAGDQLVLMGPTESLRGVERRLLRTSQP